MAEVSGVTATSAAGAAVSPRSVKYRTAATSAAMGAVSVLAMTLKMMCATTPPMAAPMPPRMALTRKVIRKATMITPNTFQPLPFTSARERPSDSNTPARSITMTGATTAKMVMKKRPGTISRMKPITTMMPTMMPAPISGAMTGAAEPEQVTRRVVAAPVLHVLDELDHHARVEGGGDQADQGREQDQESAQEALQHADDQEQAERHGEQDRSLVSVDRKYPAQYSADVHSVLHARQHTPRPGRTASARTNV